MKLFVTYMEFKSQVLWLHARASRYYEEDFYFKQTENGYEKMDEAEAKALFDWLFFKKGVCSQAGVPLSFCEK